MLVPITTGTNLYGRVLNVPGVLYVATVFKHVAFLPLAPATSWIVIEEPGVHKYLRASTQWQGLPLAISVPRSVFAAWFRTALVLFGLWNLIGEGYHGMTRFEPVAWPWVGGAVAAIVFASVAGRMGRARYQDIVQVLAMADAPGALATRVEQAFDRKILERWPGRDAGDAPQAGRWGDARSLQEADAWQDDGAAAPGDVALALTFSQRHAPRIFGAIALPLGVLLAGFQRASALTQGHYYPKLLTLGFLMVAMSIPAVTLGIGRNEDLKVPWKAAIVVVTGLVGLAAGLSAPGWFF